MFLLRFSICPLGKGQDSFLSLQFLSLLGAISTSLQLDGIEGCRPIGHIPKDERERLLREREHACEKMVNQIKVYRERINRKDELLQGYERDLAKLR